ncbi:MAG: hypothetical protein ACJ8GN_17125 [Longimicrobiaceae bacterium]
MAPRGGGRRGGILLVFLGIHWCAGIAEHGSALTAPELIRHALARATAK